MASRAFFICQGESCFGELWERRVWEQPVLKSSAGDFGCDSGPTAILMRCVRTRTSRRGDSLQVIVNKGNFHFLVHDRKGDVVDGG